MKVAEGLNLARKGQRNENMRFGWSGLVLFVGVVILGFQVATQYFAWSVQYHWQLGNGLFALPGGARVYAPWSWMVWSSQFTGIQGRVGDRLYWMHIIVMGTMVASVFSVMYLRYRRSLKKEVVEDLHGSAKFATKEDVERMGLVKKNPKGVYLGGFDFDGILKFLRYDLAAHILAMAPTRSGKGVGLVIPTLLSWVASVFVNDIKEENYQLTSGFRHRAGSLCIRFDPTDRGGKSMDGETPKFDTCRWNVLAEVRIWTDQDVMDAQNIAAAIADPDGKGMDDHWVATSYELLTATILHVLYGEVDKSLPGVGVYLADPSFTDPEQMFNRMLSCEHDPEGIMGWRDSMGQPTKTHPAVALGARAMLNKEERERNSVLSTAKARLALWAETIVARNTAYSDFRITDLMNHEKPVSLYFVIPPSDKERLRPLLRLFITMMIRRLTESMRFEDGAGARDYLHRLLLMIDELPALRKLDVLEDGLGYIAGYGITAFLIIQDYPQLKKYFTEQQAIVSGCHVRVAYAPNTSETAEMLSKMTGITTVDHETVGFSGKRNSHMLDQMNVQIAQVQRPLMTADEVTRLSAEESLIFLAGEPVIRGKKIKYYAIPEFLRRAKMQPPARIGMAWTDSTKSGTPAQYNWLMLSVEREAGGLVAAINCYRDYPPVRVVVKQFDFGHNELRSFTGRLVDDKGAECVGPLLIDKVTYQLELVDGAGFDEKEAFEVHLRLQAPEKYTDSREEGFFSTLSEYERDARDMAKKWYRGEKDASISFDPVSRNSVCRGKAVLQTDRCLILERNDESLSVHRKERLSGLVKIGDQVLIRYQDFQGVVEWR